MDKVEVAEKVVAELGGLESAANMFGYTNKMSLYFNWRYRGIPKCHHFAIFKKTGIDVSQEYTKSTRAA